MTKAPTQKELELAKEINRLETAAYKPPLNGGILASAVSFITSKVSRGILSAAIAVFLGVHAWQMFNEAPKLLFDLDKKRNEIKSLVAETRSLTEMVGNATRLRQTMLAQLDEIQGQATAAQAQADAASHERNGHTARLAKLLAELAEKRAKRDMLREEARANLTAINGTAGATAQKRAEVTNLEAEANKKVADLALKIKVSSSADDMEREIDKDINTMFRGR